MKIKIGGNEIKDKFKQNKKLDKKYIETLINLTSILNETIKFKTDIIERQTEIIEKQTEENYRLNDILTIKQYYEKSYIPIEKIKKLKEKFKGSNKYMLTLSYENIKELFEIIDFLMRKENNNGTRDRR